MQLTGLHHVTAVTGNPAKNVDFYTRVLGLRLVKKTVNQDDVSAYHLFYGDDSGHPGTEITFFDWSHIGKNVPGTGMIDTISFRVPNREALDWWAKHLVEQGVEAVRSELYGRDTITFADTEGMRLALIDDGNTPSEITPWKQSSIPEEYAIRGFYTANIVIRNLEPTARVLTEVLGFRLIKEYQLSESAGHRLYVYEMGDGGPGAEFNVEVRPGGSSGRLGIGGVHHIAFRTPNPEEHQRWRDHIAGVGVNITEVIDRFYFKSIYFRIPGGVLFEIATDGPGFATDEDIEHLGERLSLPPFLEGYREKIEAGLKPIA